MLITGILAIPDAADLSSWRFLFLSVVLSTSLRNRARAAGVSSRQLVCSPGSLPIDDKHKTSGLSVLGNFRIILRFKVYNLLKFAEISTVSPPSTGAWFSSLRHSFTVYTPAAIVSAWYFALLTRSQAYRPRRSNCILRLQHNAGAINLRCSSFSILRKIGFRLLLRNATFASSALL